jgi:hypothetical protein
VPDYTQDAPPEQEQQTQHNGCCNQLGRKSHSDRKRGREVD